jgi:hypothetical protein
MRLFRFITDLLKPHRQTFQNDRKRELGWWPASPGFL